LQTRATPARWRERLIIAPTSSTIASSTLWHDRQRHNLPGFHVPVWERGVLDRAQVARGHSAVRHRASS
jgi:hypothetical protein